jgi:DMSO/TMAO reductase YedYZ molybdopterin-dependent catalytic subunit
MTPGLPPGQRERSDLPRFGLPWFAHRMPRSSGSIAIAVPGRAPVTESELRALGEHHQVSDIHCVATWSYRGLAWTGTPFRAMWDAAMDAPDSTRRLRFHGADGYGSTMVLEDALADDVLIAYELGNEPLPLAHGPARLVAPSHYGFKSVKHLVRIEPLPAPGRQLRLSLKHPRGRVAHEERFLGIPAWLVRILYRPFAPLNMWWFRWVGTRQMRR